MHLAKKRDEKRTSVHLLQHVVPNAGLMASVEDGLPIGGRLSAGIEMTEPRAARTRAHTWRMEGPKTKR